MSMPPVKEIIFRVFIGLLAGVGYFIKSLFKQKSRGESHLHPSSCFVT